MECKDCGRYTSGEHANFCEYCGSPLRSNQQEETSNYYQNNPVNHRAPAQAVSNSSKEEPISFKNWLLTLLLPFIPIVGSLAYIVMLFVWSFDQSTPQSKKNWARASLLVSLISLVIFIVLISSMVASIISGGFPFEGMDQFYY